MFDLYLVTEFCNSGLFINLHNIHVIYFIVSTCAVCKIYVQLFLYSICVWHLHLN